MILDRTHLHLLQEFKNHAWKDSKHRISKQEDGAWNWAELEVYRGTPGVYLSAELNDAGTIELLNLSYTVNSIWGLKRNSIGEWVIGLTRARDVSTKVRTHQIERLIWPVMQIMESEGRFSFYMVRRIPKRVYWNNIQKYLKEVHPAIGNIDRYDPHCMYILQTPEQRTGLSRLHEMLTPDTWPANRNIAVLRHDLKYENRT